MSEGLLGALSCNTYCEAVDRMSCALLVKLLRAADCPTPSADIALSSETTAMDITVIASITVIDTINGLDRTASSLLPRLGPITLYTMGQTMFRSQGYLRKCLS